MHRPTSRGFHEHSSTNEKADRCPQGITQSTARSTIRLMLVKLKNPLVENIVLLGIDAVPVEVEVDCADIGMPKTILVGLPEAAVKESTYRIERAIENSGYFNPIHRTVINLVPAENASKAAVVEGLRVFPVASLMQSTPNFIDGQVCGQIGFSESRAFQKELPRALQILCKRQVSRHVFSSQVNYAHV